MRAFPGLSATLLSLLVLLSGCQATGRAAHVRAPRRTPQAYLSDRDKSNLLRLAYAVLDHEAGRAGDDAKSLERALEGLVLNYETVFVSIYQQGVQLGSRAARQIPAQPKQLSRDVRRATLAVIGSSRFDKQTLTSDPASCQLVIEILHNKQALTNPTLKRVEQFLEPGIHAIELEQGKHRAIFSAAVLIVKNYSLKQTLQQLAKTAGLGENGYLHRSTKLFRYETVTFTGDRQGKVTDLYRCNVLIQPDALTLSLLKHRLRLAGAWLRNNVNPTTGLLAYQYEPTRDRYTQTTNHPAQLASLWTIARLANFVEEPDTYRRLITRLLDQSLRIAKPDGRGGLYLYLDGEATIASNAMAILALAEWRDYPNCETLLRQLAQGIVNQQTKEGSYRTVFGELSTTQRINEHPGMAMLALLHAYRLTREPSYLASVERAFPFYRNHWWKARNAASVSWQAQVGLALYQETKQPRYATFVFEMTDWLIATLQLTVPRYVDELGGFAPKTAQQRPNASTSSYVEGLNAAYRLAALVKDQKHAKKYAQAIRFGTRFILQTQYTKDNTFYLKNTKRAIGGFRQSLTRGFQRIDYTQHAVTALIGAYDNRLFDENSRL